MTKWRLVPSETPSVVCMLPNLELTAISFKVEGQVMHLIHMLSSSFLPFTTKFRKKFIVILKDGIYIKLQGLHSLLFCPTYFCCHIPTIESSPLLSRFSPFKVGQAGARSQISNLVSLFANKFKNQSNPSIKHTFAFSKQSQQHTAVGLMHNVHHQNFL